MVAYLTAQFIDVQVFHYLKEKTKGKMLWLRNNVSTLISQLVDTIAVILITHFYANGLPTNELGELTHPLIYFEEYLQYSQCVAVIYGLLKLSHFLHSVYLLK